MKNLSLFLIVDNLFKFTLIFIINIIWLVYFINNSAVSLIISLALSILMLMFINLYNRKKFNKNKNFLIEEQKIIDIKNTFLVMTNCEIVDFFYNLALKKHKALKFSKYIKVIASPNPIILYPYFKQSEFNEDDFLCAYKQFKNQQIKKLIILTNKSSANIGNLNFNLNFEILLLNYKEVYFNLLKQYEYYPQILIKTKPKVKNTFKQLLKYSLNKKKTKAYLFSALFILFSSLFVRAKLYYLIISTVLLFLALFAYFNPTFNKIEQTKILE